jgi:hypothetical protein
MTTVSARRLFEEYFAKDGLTVSQFGNVLSVTCFLQGVAAEELSANELDHFDLAYPLIIAVRAQKTGNASL